MSEDIGLSQNGKAIEGFSAKCTECGSDNVNIEYEFNYYGGFTGYDQSLYIECRDCENKTDLDT